MAAMTTTATDFDGFYLAHYGETVAMTYGFTADLAESQDIAQEAFSRAWQR
jgi:DNA-directed RNA polymerase specialized sigma24 family protein